MIELVAGATFLGAQVPYNRVYFEVPATEAPRYGRFGFSATALREYSLSDFLRKRLAISKREVDSRAAPL